MLQKVVLPLDVFPDSKVHGANMGPTWVLSAPDGPHVDSMNIAIRVLTWCLVNNLSQIPTVVFSAYKQLTWEVCGCLYADATGFCGICWSMENYVPSCHRSGTLAVDREGFGTKSLKWSWINGQDHYQCQAYFFRIFHLLQNNDLILCVQISLLSLKWKYHWLHSNNCLWFHYFLGIEVYRFITIKHQLLNWLISLCLVY